MSSAATANAAIPTRHLGGRGGRGNSRSWSPWQPKSADETVPILKFGTTNNWIDFKKKMSTAAKKKFGELGFIIDKEIYPTYPATDKSGYVTQNDPFGFEKARLIELEKERLKKVSKLEHDKIPLYAFIYSKLSRESDDELKRSKDYNKLHEKGDPSELWKALKKIHLVTTVSKNAAIVLQQAKMDYFNIRMGDLELFSWYNERFRNKLQAYEAAMPNGSAKESDASSGMYFLCPLSNNYRAYYSHRVNEINADPTKAPKSIQEVYEQASNWISIDTSSNPLTGGKGVSFSTGIAMVLNRRRQKRNPGGRKSELSGYPTSSDANALL